MMIATHWGTNQVDSAVIDQLLIINEVLRSEKDEIILQLDKAEKEIAQHIRPLLNSITGDCYMGEEWEKDKAVSLLNSLKKMNLQAG